MTLQKFVMIAQHIANQMEMVGFWRPDAACVSRKMFNDLTEDVQCILLATTGTDVTARAHVCGLALFVDDDMPDEYYQIGYKKQFIDYFTRKKKRYICGEG